MSVEVRLISFGGLVGVNVVSFVDFKAVFQPLTSSYVDATNFRIKGLSFLEHRRLRL